MYFVDCFTIEGYNVFVTIEFFPYVSIMEERFSQDPSNDGTQEFGNVDTFLNYIITNRCRFTLLCFISLLEYFHCWTISLLGWAFHLCWPICCRKPFKLLKILVGPNLGVKQKMESFKISLIALVLASLIIIFFKEKTSSMTTSNYTLHPKLSEYIVPP